MSDRPLRCQYCGLKVPLEFSPLLEQWFCAHCMSGKAPIAQDANETEIELPTQTYSPEPEFDPQGAA